MTIVAVGQLCSSSNMAANAIAASKLIKEASKLKCKLIVLPEASDYIADNAIHSKKIVKTVEESPFLQGILKTIKELGDIDVAVGVHEPSGEIGELPRTKNTLLYFNCKGELIERYQKVHLFDVDIPNGAIMRESDSVQPGKSLIKPVKSPIGLLGLAICYDLRFPKLALKQREMGAEIIMYPSAWTMKTGLHFQPLGVATAIFSQSFVLLPAQVGIHGDTKRESWGHSCIIDPNGVILAQVGGNKEGICFADIDLNIVKDLRDKMPLIDQAVNI